MTEKSTKSKQPGKTKGRKGKAEKAAETKVAEEMKATEEEAPKEEMEAKHSDGESIAAAEPKKEAAEKKEPKAPEAPKRGLTISGNELTAEEESSLRKMAELHYRRKGVLFQGSKLDQTRLENLLSDRTFVANLGRLKSKL